MKKRNSTKEYNDFLGFSIGAIAELEEDCDDVWRGVYPELFSTKGIMGTRGIMGEKGSMEPRPFQSSQTLQAHQSLQSSQTSQFSQPPQTSQPSRSPQPLQSHSSLSTPFRPLDIDKLKFYPLDRTLPPIVQLKLRCKELNYLLHKIQTSLETKMIDEGTMSSGDKFKIMGAMEREKEMSYEKLLQEQGMIRTKDGRVVKKEEIC